MIKYKDKTWIYNKSFEQLLNEEGYTVESTFNDDFLQLYNDNNDLLFQAQSHRFYYLLDIHLMLNDGDVLLFNHMGDMQIIWDNY